MCRKQKGGDLRQDLPETVAQFNQYLCKNGKPFVRMGHKARGPYAEGHMGSQFPQIGNVSDLKLYMTYSCEGGNGFFVKHQDDDNVQHAEYRSFVKKANPSKGGDAKLKGLNS